MGDSGTMTEDEREIEQPTDSVVDEVEEGVTPQDADTDQDEYELTVDAEPDTETAKDETDWRAVAKAKADKFKKAREAREKAEREKAELEERLAKQEAMLRELTAKKRPTLSDHDYDEEAYAAALLEWNQSQVSTKPKPAQQNQATIDESVLEEQIESAERMRSQLKTYDESENKLKSKVTDAGADFDQVSYGIAEICSTYGIDYATSVLALSEVPGVFEKVAESAKDERSVVRILRKASQKVKIQPKRKIETKPEPQISGGGAVSSLQAEFQKAEKRYKETGRLEDFKAMSAAKKRLKEGS